MTSQPDYAALRQFGEDLAVLLASDPAWQALDFEEIHRRYLPRVMAFALAAGLYQRVDREDVASAAFARLWRVWPAFRTITEKSAVAYLLLAAHAAITDVMEHAPPAGVTVESLAADEV